MGGVVVECGIKVKIPSSVTTWKVVPASPQWGSQGAAAVFLRGDSSHSFRMTWGNDTGIVSPPVLPLPSCRQWRQDTSPTPLFESLGETRRMVVPRCGNPRLNSTLHTTHYTLHTTHYKLPSPKKNLLSQGQEKRKNKYFSCNYRLSVLTTFLNRAKI
jgi:hypothetical protein